MNAYKVSVNQISNALRSENVELPVGTINNQNQEMVIQVNGLVKTPNEFNQIIVAQNRSRHGCYRACVPSQAAQVVDGKPRLSQRHYKWSTCGGNGYYQNVGRQCD